MPNTTQNYNLKKPLKNEFVDVNILNENMDILDLNLKSVSEKTNTAVQSVKIGNTEYKNGTEAILPKYPSTPAEVGLGNVPNVSTNNQTPTYTEASNISSLSSGEKLSTAFGKISKAITDLIYHLSDVVKHITNTERTNWNNAYTHSTSAHAPSNAEVNQNAFSKIKVGSTVLSSDSKSGTFELLAGNNVTLTPNKSGNKITISSSSSSGGLSGTNPNLLDNPWFTINQRGQTIYTEGYCFDRWILQSVSGNAQIDISDITLDYMKITTQNNDGIKQVIKKGILVNGEYTISFNDGTNIYSKTFTYDSSSDIVQLYDNTTSIYFAVINLGDGRPVVYPYVRYDGLTISTLKAVKLEKGKISTLANDIIPNYSFELIKCSTSTVDSSDTYANKIVSYNPTTYQIDEPTTNLTNGMIWIK